MTEGTRTMREVDHSHPVDQRTAGALFRRGPTVIADGGRRKAKREPAEDEEEQLAEKTMKEVSHTPPHGEGANEVHRRGRDEDE